jgi:hypothetical protein
MLVTGNNLYCTTTRREVLFGESASSYTDIKWDGDVIGGVAETYMGTAHL